MIKKCALAALVFAMSVAVTPALARDLPSGGVTREFVVNWLKSKGLPATIEQDESAQKAYVASTFDDIKFGIYFYNCQGDVCKAIQYSAGWSLDETITKDKVNSWNTEYRYIRGYMTDKTVRGEYDLDVSPGGTYEQLDASLERWKAAIVAYGLYLAQ